MGRFKALFMAATVAVLLLPSAGATAADKVAICHRPVDNPDNVTLMSVGRAALADHLGHGDNLAYNGNCYVVVAPDATTATAEQTCVDRYGGHLASIHSEAENDFVGTLIDPAGVGGITARLGAVGTFCQGPSATYAWTDGSAWDYTDWRAPHDLNWWIQEPSCSAGGAAGAVQLWPDSNPVGQRGWNDIPVNAPLDGFVCKYAPKR